MSLKLVAAVYVVNGISLCQRLYERARSGGFGSVGRLEGVVLLGGALLAFYLYLGLWRMDRRACRIAIVVQVVLLGGLLIANLGSAILQFWKGRLPDALARLLMLTLGVVIHGSMLAVLLEKMPMIARQSDRPTSGS